MIVGSLNSGVGTLAQMLATPATAGAYFHTKDSKTNGYGVVLGEGNDFVGDGTIWQPRGPQLVVKDSTLASPGVKQTAEQLIKSIQILPGLLHMRRFLIEFEVGKTGATDASGQFNIRLGPTGTLAGDSFLAQTSTTLLAAGKRSAGYSLVMEALSINTAQKRGSAGGIDNGSFNNTTSGTALGTVATLTGVNLQTTAQIMTFAALMNAATADSPQVGGVYIYLLP